MAIENVEKFDALLRSSEELQGKLKAVGDAYTGDRADEQAFFDAVMAPLAQEAGLAFTLDEVRESIASGAALDDAELGSAAGGRGLCFIIGGTQEDSTTWHCSSTDFGVGACSYVGVSFASYR